ncbi:hypothetical protein Turpa_2215 [Turneriella parva DSM 21527]|uniref:Uncharacterized protein n=1 Tax=Turneriella parva (strain ATCC BAA-1111 / DSM 21527 / NCTC 11395 / H) TaxID=869212 RepID=I4B6F3_TURPD|nr:hypothetical protein Turpa_2215 [Turneriella parva DSM 21527]
MLMREHGSNHNLNEFPNGMDYRSVEFFEILHLLR